MADNKICIYCNEDGENLCHNDWWNVYVTHAHLSMAFNDDITEMYSSVIPKINYCPMCGRKLEEDL